MDVSAQNSTKTQPPVQPSVTAGSSGTKEREGIAISQTSEIQAVPEVSVPPEVEKAGVKAYTEKVEIPQVAQKLGVQPSAQSIPVSIPTQSVPVVLPLSDDQVVRGLHQPILSALRWLSEWCIKQLKKAHMTIKFVHGKIMRVPIK
ncbi:hypothetical protein A2773_07220 [Candidatus Gottesmanbacteria bacterium RIFCSPHIGHO2_01_FULL_39_10]|uniref:Uncharacterized protein n=1 Tax=Candidatus Gottesmanbacteria bacterium RIFCSPHIGHO2_01_FULL_39_10 TaxID=1798375 RepID=A0A1F5ZNL0_9BACT|nr:MAG: hypothetical protein A2773_07220 [Candidatus Gottesmanbacteria bacterium RIFCSPHIGHO2_01_FULL_39_10]